MTIERKRLDGQSTPAPGASPTAMGWGEAAVAVNSVLQFAIPMLMKLEFDAREPLYIDFRHHAFAWSTLLADFPADAVLTGLQTEPTGPETPLLFDLPGRDLDGLLWLIGINAFRGARASWLTADGRYKLTRWPNLTQHAHNMQQMHMMAMLGNAYLSVSELAAMANVAEPEAQRLINAMSLMRILKHSTEVPAAVIAEPPAARRASLFTRLRAKLGR